MHVAAYVEQHPGSKPTVKQHLAAIRMLFDWLVIGQVVPVNPAASVRGPKYVVRKGKTPVLKAQQARQLLDSIDTGTIAGLRDRALIGVMVYSFARVSAVIGMRVEDYYQNGKRWWIRLHEKGGKRHEVPAHHNAEAYLDARIEFALSVAESFYKHEAFEKAGFLFLPMFVKLLKALRSNRGDKETLLTLLRHIRRDHLQNAIDIGIKTKDLLIAAKNFLMQDLCTLKDFTCFVEFGRDFGGIITEQDQQLMAKKFHDYYSKDFRDYAQENMTWLDPDSPLEVCFELEDVAAFFNADVSEWVQRLEDYAMGQMYELSAFTRSYQAPQAVHSGTEIAGADADIDSLFEALLD